MIGRIDTCSSLSQSLKLVIHPSGLDHRGFCQLSTPSGCVTYFFPPMRVYGAEDDYGLYFIVYLVCHALQRASDAVFPIDQLG